MVTFRYAEKYCMRRDSSWLLLAEELCSNVSLSRFTLGTFFYLRAWKSVVEPAVD